MRLLVTILLLSAQLIVTTAQPQYQGVDFSQTYYSNNPDDGNYIDFSINGQSPSGEGGQFYSYRSGLSSIVINGQPMPYGQSSMTANSLWIQEANQLMRYMQCSVLNQIKLVAYSTGGYAIMNEVYPDGHSIQNRYYFQPGYNEIIFAPDVPGRHTLGYEVNGQLSNMVTIDVIGQNQEGAYTPPGQPFNPGQSMTGGGRNNNLSYFSVISPINEERFAKIEPIEFIAMVNSNSSLDGSQIEWISDLDGPLGTGQKIRISKLSVGNHNIEVKGYGSRVVVPIRVFNDLLELYKAPPSQDEINRVLNEFKIKWIDGQVRDEKWENYDTFQFDQTSKNPSKIAAIAKIDVLRHQKFSLPLPFTGGRSIYDYLKSNVKEIDLRLDCGFNSATGADTISLDRGFSLWGPSWSSPPDKPDLCKEPYNLPYNVKYGCEILVHEARHNEHGDPGHVTNDVGMDPSFEGGSGFAYAAMYSMWIYKYGISDPPSVKAEDRDFAKLLLESRFISRPTHSNSKVQAIIDELMSPDITHDQTASSSRSSNLTQISQPRSVPSLYPDTAYSQGQTSMEPAFPS